MTKGIPYWRFVSDDDDGHTIYQCLSCKEKWDAHCHYMHGQFVYCPWCGIKFVGERKWRVDYTYGSKEYETHEKMQSCRYERETEIFYLVERRTVFVNKDGVYEPHGFWETEHASRHDRCEEHGDVPVCIEEVKFDWQSETSKRNARRLQPLREFQFLITHEPCDRTFQDMGTEYRLVAYASKYGPYQADRQLVGVVKSWRPTLIPMIKQEVI